MQSNEYAREVCIFATMKLPNLLFFHLQIKEKQIVKGELFMLIWSCYDDDRLQCKFKQECFYENFILQSQNEAFVTMTAFLL